MMRVKTIRLSPPYRFADAMLVMGAMRMRAETMTAVGDFFQKPNRTAARQMQEASRAMEKLTRRR